jgi:hypothetical protein
MAQPRFRPQQCRRVRGLLDGTYKSEFWYEHFWRIWGYAYGAHKSHGAQVSRAVGGAS